MAVLSLVVVIEWAKDEEHVVPASDVLVKLTSRRFICRGILTNTGQRPTSQIEAGSVFPTEN